MLGSPFRPVAEAELLDRDGDRLFLRVGRPVPEGAEPSFRLRLPDGGQTRPLKVAVESCRPLVSQGYLLAVFSAEAEGLGEIPAAPKPDEALRQAPRIDCHICVVSRDLPGYRAVTVDYSQGGIQIEVSGALELGASLLMRLEFGMDSLPCLECRGRVAWCAQRARNRYRVGLEFVGLDGRSRDILERFESILRKRDQTSILHRVLFGNDHGQEPIPAPAGPSGPNLATIGGNLHQGVVERYAVEQGELTLLLRRPGDQLVEYSFSGLRGLTDLGATTNHQVADLVERPCATAYQRFAFVDPEGNPVVEVVATGQRRVEL